jgi:hypothetical protein
MDRLLYVFSCGLASRDRRFMGYVDTSSDHAASFRVTLLLLWLPVFARRRLCWNTYHTPLLFFYQSFGLSSCNLAQTFFTTTLCRGFIQQAQKQLCRSLEPFLTDCLRSRLLLLTTSDTADFGSPLCLSPTLLSKCCSPNIVCHLAVSDAECNYLTSFAQRHTLLFHHHSRSNSNCEAVNETPRAACSCGGDEVLGT